MSKRVHNYIWEGIVKVSQTLNEEKAEARREKLEKYKRKKEKEGWDFSVNLIFFNVHMEADTESTARI